MIESTGKQGRIMVTRIRKRNEAGIEKQLKNYQVEGEKKGKHPTGTFGALRGANVVVLAFALRLIQVLCTYGAVEYNDSGPNLERLARLREYVVRYRGEVTANLLLAIVINNGY